MERVPSAFELHLRDQFHLNQQPQQQSMRTTRLQREQQPVQIHQDECTDEEGDTVMDESMGPLDESGATVTDSEDEEVEESVAEDIQKFEESFRNINKRFRLINRIGEGRYRPLNGGWILPALTSTRHLLHGIQSRRSSLRQTRQ